MKRKIVFYLRLLLIFGVLSSLNICELRAQWEDDGWWDSVWGDEGLYDFGDYWGRDLDGDGDIDQISYVNSNGDVVVIGLIDPVEDSEIVFDPIDEDDPYVDPNDDPNNDPYDDPNNDPNNNSEPKDCAGVEGGSAYLDACGECVGGTTGKEPCATYDPCDSDFDYGAVFIQAEARALFPFIPEGIGMTSSTAVGYMLDGNGKIAWYYSSTVGISNGVGVIGGITVGVMPLISDISKLEGLAVNAGFTYAIGAKGYGGEANVIWDDVSLDEMDWDNLHLGGSMSVPYLSYGVGAGLYLDVSNTTIHSLNMNEVSWDNFASSLSEGLPIELNEEEAFDLLTRLISLRNTYNRYLRKDCDE